MNTLNGMLESFSMKIDGLKGLELTMSINGEPYIFNLPNVSIESRVTVFAKLHDNIGQSITVIAAPPGSIVFTLGNTTIRFGL
jgi:hypothetical protein